MIARTIAAIVAVLAIGSAAVAQDINRPAPEPFKDVPRDHWAFEAVESLRQKGIVNGYPDGAYRGKRSISRYEMAAGLDRAFRTGTSSQTGPQGHQGPRGPQGPQGPQGPRGPQGVAPQELSLLREILKEMRAEVARLNGEIGSTGQRLDGVSQDLQGTRKSLSPLPHK